MVFESAEAKRIGSLAAVCLQSTALAIIINISQHVTNKNNQPYKASSAVLITELGKLGLSTALAMREVMMEEDRSEKTSKSDVQSFERDSSPFRHFNNFVVTYGEGKDEEKTLLVNGQSNVSQPIAGASRPTSLSSIITKVVQRVCAPGLVHMAIPAFLFLLQNNLIYVAARSLSMPVFQISFQLKTVITALTAVLMLNRRYKAIQWASLFLLGIGVAAVQLGAHAAPHATHSASESNSLPIDASHDFSSQSHQLIGLSAVVISCFASAIAATYFELVLKKPPPPTPKSPKEPPLRWSRSYSVGAKHIYSSLPMARRPSSLAELRRSSVHVYEKLKTAIPSHEELTGRQEGPTSLWVRNIQLSLYSLFFSWGVSWWTSANAEPSSGEGFFVGFTVFTWIVIVIQAVGGLLTALVIKYADNVAKGFALSASAVLTFALSIVFFNYQLTLQTTAGALIVLATAFTFECHEQVSSWIATVQSRLFGKQSMTYNRIPGLTNRSI